MTMAEGAIGITEAMLSISKTSPVERIGMYSERELIDAKRDLSSLLQWAGVSPDGDRMRHGSRHLRLSCLEADSLP